MSSTVRRFSGQTAVVTGAARGLGFAAAGRLAAEGARVALFDRDAEALDAAAGSLGGDETALALAVDVTDEEAVGRGVEAVLAETGRIDVLVNNAGIYPHFPFEELTFADWRSVLATNLDSVYLCSHAVYPGMRERGYGRIVNVSSATFFIGYPGLSAYVASKGGIVGFTRALASEAGPHGITVNAVTPGLIATEGVVGGEEAGLFDEIVPDQAVGRRGEPEDIAEAIAYLASPAASFITGQTVNVDGGHRYH
ncbi:MAG TPA: SDR family NAD(P)-dependent oxidoreductase [Gaiellaceae bacterium]|nr:SDR family NAD(P)-dependent oxidoreductase [Gaiellaceae bacterium]